MSLPASAEQATQFIWWTSLILGLIASLVVAFLLWLIHRKARIINQRVAKIWEVGQRVANNTIHIPILYRINEVAGQILNTATRINTGAEAIESHVNGCPGCPDCLMTHK